ncbi:uncharacterized protein LOC124168657 [Ischnura elegans]|uniref:uncharacterized protein LOC124168657 n=1 Tax=Ischnura elegans TaxID=197161 RepID=UPI001ED886FE|nr:uncharacterized protein LOC124168657 [Ischnura elegans]
MYCYCFVFWPFHSTFRIQQEIDRRSLGRRVKDQKARVIAQINERLKAASYVSTTADIWSTKTRSFLGVTAHWIDEQTLMRHSAALACRRFCSPHTHDKIAEMLEDIHLSFGLSAGKIVSTVTDNGANFSKAFKIFGVDLKVPCSDVESESDVDEESDENSSVLFASDDVEEESMIRLPHHVRCASHTLNLLATTDTAKIIEKSPSLSRVHHMAMGKCTFLWNASGRPHSAEKIFSILGQKLSYPGVTRWNS